MDYKEKVIALLNSQELSKEQKEMLETIFPELKESEGERIRKALIHLINEHYGYLTAINGISVKDILAWLEEQGEQKSDDKVEQKGMNIVEEDMTPFQKKVSDIIDTAIEEEQGLKQVCDELLKLAHNENMQNPAWSGVDKDILFRITNNLKFLKDTISIDPKYAVNSIDIEREITWLKSLRPQSQWKPSEEQLKSLQEVIDAGHFTSYPNALETLCEQLKKLREEDV